MTRCEVCDRPKRSNPPVMVISSALVAYSFAICFECANETAEPIHTVEAMLEACGGDWSNVNPGVKRAIMVYKDGRYQPCTVVSLAPCGTCGKPTATPKLCYSCYMRSQQDQDDQSSYT